MVIMLWIKIKFQTPHYTKQLKEKRPYVRTKEIVFNPVNQVDGDASLDKQHARPLCMSYSET